jgi:hypothetical protein
VDAIKHELVVEIKSIFHTWQTCLRDKKYLIKYKGYHHKEVVWIKLTHLDHMLNMVAKSKHGRGHKLGVKKNPFKESLNVDEGINPF